MPHGYVIMARYDGPPGPLTVARHEDDRSVWIGGDPGVPALTFPWGPADQLSEAGAFARAAAGVRSSEGGLGLVVQVEVTGRRLKRPRLRISVDDGPSYTFERPRFGRRRLAREGRVVGTRVEGATAHVAADATSLDAVIVALVWASVVSMTNTGPIPGFAGLPDGPFPT